MNEVEFIGQAKRCLPDGVSKDVLHEAYRVYLRAKEDGECHDFCIIGRQDALNWCLSSANESSPDIYENQERCNFDAGNGERTGHFLNARNWNIVLNDAWILGGIETRKTFYLSCTDGFSSVDSVKKIIEGSGAHPVTVTGRELIGLWGFGYVPKRLPDGSLGFSRNPDDKSVNIEYQKYHGKILEGMQIGGKDNLDVCWGNLRHWLAQAFK